MAEGTILELRGTYGFITPPHGSARVFFHKTVLQDIQFRDLREGMLMEYQEIEGDRGPRATSVRPVSIPQDDSYRFLNPYNFVRYLEAPSVDEDTPRDQRLLWRCLPPPHDRYVGLSGKITCTVEAVTPLFVSDSHAVRIGEEEHPSYRFFQYEGKPALPASSLRGMMRSVFEAITNSCFGVFDGGRLSTRVKTTSAPKLVPARVELRDDRWQLRLLTGTTELSIRSIPQGRQYAAWLAQYWPLKPSKTLRGMGRKGNQTQEARKRDLIRRTRNHTGRNPDALSHGSPAYALLRPFRHPHPKIQFWDVVEVRKKREDLPQPQNGERIESGWLCITNRNIEAKHSERFFFRSEDNTVGPRTVDLSPQVRETYEDLIRDYQRLHTKEREKRGKKCNSPAQNEPALSRFICDVESGKVQDGTLVYAKLEGTIQNPKAEFIVPVAVSRIAYEHTVGELLGLAPHLIHCDSYDHLCPACRTFGWIHPEPPEDSPDVVTAYAGRVRFSHAHHLSDNGTLDPTPLAVLSSPKPTTTQFYLLDSEGQPDAYVDYDISGAQLRGRKFYRHHDEAAPAEYEYQGKKPSDQHRTVRDALKPGAKFEFTVEFENVMPVELSTLLFALELEPDLVHRLGYAKPLGFGSIRLRVKSLALMEWKTRFDSLKPEAGWQAPETESQISQRKTDFLKQMRALYSREAFEGILTDLRALLGLPPEGVPIHYPRPQEQLDIENHPQFEWFVGNKKRVQNYPKGKIEHPPEVLRRAAEDREGLPLIDAKGDPVS